MTRGFAAQHAAVLLQHREHVTVADPGAQELDALGGERMLETEVAHDRADDRALADAVRLRSRAMT